MGFTTSSITRITLIPLLAATFLAPTLASAASTDESITQLHISADLSASDVLDVTERITYDYGDATPHALLHQIPLSYHDDQGRDYRIKIVLLDARLGDKSFDAHLNATPQMAKLTLPAGTKANAYTLHYTLSPVIISGITADIFKMNITGASWPVPIRHATAILHSPPGIIADEPTCSTGSEGVATSTCEITESDAGRTVSFVSEIPLQAGDVMSIAATFPQGKFSKYLVPHERFPIWSIYAAIGLLAALALAGLVSLIIGLSRRLRRSRTK